MFFRESIRECLKGENPLPQWYLLLDAEGNPVGGAGLCGMSALSAEPGADVRAFRVAGGWGETECRKTLIAHLKKEAAHLGFRYLACRGGDSAGLGIPDCGGGSETPSQNGFSVSGSRRRRGGIDDGPGACLYRGLHRQRLLAWNVRGAQCAGFHDYGGGGAGRQTGLPDAGWRTRSSVRKLSRISDAAGCPEPADENSAFPFRFPERIS